jgi:predicted DNA-binding WGR domain protein
LKSPYLTASYTNSVGPIKFGIEIYLTRLLFFKTLRRLGAIFETPCIDSRGETVIDYGMVNEEAWERVEEFRIGERVESDHLEIALRKRRRGKEQRKKGVGDRHKTVFFLELLFYV